MSNPYQLLGGDDGVKKLCNAFYDAMQTLETVKDVRQMHNDNLDEIKHKLYLYMSGWLGGPHLYEKKYNTICLTEPHSHFKINEDHRDQWLACMDVALVNIGASEEVKSMLKERMFALADFMIND